MTHFLIELTCCYYHINVHKMMSAQGGAIFLAPFMSPGEYQSTEVPQFCPYLPISPKLGMGIGFGSGMVNMYCSAGHPMISSAPSEGLHPSLAAGVGLPLMPASRNLAVSQMQMPCVRSQQLRPSVDTSAMPPSFVLGRYSPAFNFSNEVESSSKTMPGTSNDHHQQVHIKLCSIINSFTSTSQFLLIFLAF